MTEYYQAVKTTLDKYNDFNEKSIMISGQLAVVRGKLVLLHKSALFLFWRLCPPRVS